MRSLLSLVCVPSRRKEKDNGSRPASCSSWARACDSHSERERTRDIIHRRIELVDLEPNYLESEGNRDYRRVNGESGPNIVSGLPAQEQAGVENRTFGRKRQLWRTRFAAWESRIKCRFWRLRRRRQRKMLVSTSHRQSRDVDDRGKWKRLRFAKASDETVVHRPHRRNRVPISTSFIRSQDLSWPRSSSLSGERSHVSLQSAQPSYICLDCEDEGELSAERQALDESRGRQTSRVLSLSKTYRESLLPDATVLKDTSHRKKVLIRRLMSSDAFGAPDATSRSASSLSMASGLSGGDVNFSTRSPRKYIFDDNPQIQRQSSMSPVPPLFVSSKAVSHSASAAELDGGLDVPELDEPLHSHSSGSIKSPRKHADAEQITSQIPTHAGIIATSYLAINSASLGISIGKQAWMQGASGLLSENPTLGPDDLGSNDDALLSIDGISESKSCSPDQTRRASSEVTSASSVHLYKMSISERLALSKSALQLATFNDKELDVHCSSEYSQSSSSSPRDDLTILNHKHVKFISFDGHNDDFAGPPIDLSDLQTRPFSPLNIVKSELLKVRISAEHVHVSTTIPESEKHTAVGASREPNPHATSDSEYRKDYQPDSSSTQPSSSRGLLSQESFVVGSEPRGMSIWDRALLDHANEDFKLSKTNLGSTAARDTSSSSKRSSVETTQISPRTLLASLNHDSGTSKTGLEATLNAYKLPPRPSVSVHNQASPRSSTSDTLSLITSSPRSKGAAWCRFPSHTALTRGNVSADERDDVIPRDFAPVVPSQTESINSKLNSKIPRPASTSPSYPGRRPEHAIIKARGVHSKEDKRSLKSKYGSKSVEYMSRFVVDESHGHRSSISHGAQIVNYPELEMLPPNLSVQPRGT